MQEILRPCADLRSCAVDPDREIADQADAHSGRFGRGLGRAERFGRDPLQEGVKENRSSPTALSCLEPGVPIERAAAFAHEGVESDGHGRVSGKVMQHEVIEQAAQQRVLFGGDLRPIDQRSLRQRIAALDSTHPRLAEHCRGIGEQGVQE